MNFQPQFLRIAILPMASLLLIVVGAARPVLATPAQGTSAAERYVLESAELGIIADLTKLSKDERELTGEFVTKLLIRGTKSKDPPDIFIKGAVITQEIVLIEQEIPYEVSFINCTFENDVIFDRSHFAKDLNFSYSHFESLVRFSGITVDRVFLLAYSQFKSNVFFDRMRMRQDFGADGATFNSDLVSFESTSVAGDFSVDESKFTSRVVSFEQMRVDGSFSARSCVFRYDPEASQEPKLQEDESSHVDFVGAHFADFFLNACTFDNVSTIDFSRMQADFMSFDEVWSKTPTTINLQRMAFKLVSPVSADQLWFLLSNYNAEFYSYLEASLRTRGYPDEADKIAIAKKRIERRQKCISFLRQCDSRGAFVWSMFQDKLAGYGKNLQNLLLWSLGFLVVGAFVFRKEQGMRLKDEKDAPHYVGRYNAFWYSLDLFLPIIKLGEADVWTPKDNRRWASLYRKVHIIIGSLFVPIGLAAWTGIIK
jgi:hypothetical protein